SRFTTFGCDTAACNVDAFTFPGLIIAPTLRPDAQLPCPLAALGWLGTNWMSIEPPLLRTSVYVSQRSDSCFSIPSSSAYLPRNRPELASYWSSTGSQRGRTLPRCVAGGPSRLIYRQQSVSPAELPHFADPPFWY